MWKFALRNTQRQIVNVDLKCLTCNQSLKETTEVAKTEQRKLLEKSIDEKLAGYILEPRHPKQRALWFDKVLGSNLSNKEELIKQIILDPAKLRPVRIDDYGITYEQLAVITGGNGRKLD
jgi:hypothetical protein